MTGRWCRFFRQMCAEMIDNHVIGEDIALGGCDPETGDPIRVEKDESKFGKWNCNKGQRATANWTIGMVERTKLRQCNVIMANKRDKTACTDVTKKWVTPGLITHNNMWGGHNLIKKMCGMNCEHRRLGHEMEFVNCMDAQNEGEHLHRHAVE